ncbi:hypothetical protein ACFWXO_43280 [Kitasatospora sp. NPDC059088]|uniref:hypothetical protein n=1 Tax=Kitasatospora sp. NPDC059088 TaxID=3346722 RepID=UPI0036C5E2F1
MTTAHTTTDSSAIFEQARARHADAIAAGDLFTLLATYTVDGSTQVRARKVRVGAGYSTPEDTPRMLAIVHGVAVESIALRALI